MGVLLIDWERSNAAKLRALADILGDVIEAAKELGGSCIVTCDGSEGGTLKVSKAKRMEIPALPEDMLSLFAPIEDNAVGMPNGIRNPEYDIANAPEPTDLAHASKALNSVLRTPRQAIAPVSFKQEESTAKREDKPVGSAMAA